MTRPRGKPPTPSAASMDKQPVGITFTGTSTSRLPSRMIEPLPYDFSICDIAASRSFAFSSAIAHLNRGNWEILLCRICFERIGGVRLPAPHPQPRRATFWRSQPCSAACCFKRAMVMATSSASRRSSLRVSFRDRRKLRTRSRAALYSSSSLACSGQEIAGAEGEHMKHLLKTPGEKIAPGRNKSKYYFRPVFAHDLRLLSPSRSSRPQVSLRDQGSVRE